MLDNGKLILPIDFGTRSLEVARQAAVVARRFHAEIVVVTDGAKNPLLQEVLDGAALREVSFGGDAAQAILQVARDERATLIMLASCEREETFYPLYLGAVAARVLYESPCPVWMGAHLRRESPPAQPSIRHVLCAVDFGPNDHATIAYAAELSAPFGARLTLTHITPSVEMYGPGGTHANPIWREQLVESAKARVAELRREVGVEAEVFIGSGDVAKTLSAAAIELGADLVVIGCRPSAGALRTNAYGIVCTSYVPVLSV